jgi:hypothetical protein
MWHSGKNPLKRVSRTSESVHVPKGLRVRRLHKALLRYHDANNWPLIREALKAMARSDLIGSAKHQLVPAWQPAGTGGAPPKPAAGAPKATPAGRRVLTQHTGLPPAGRAGRSSAQKRGRR